jgi:hypothetical protein
MSEALESHQWRAFRLFLVSLHDEELRGVGKQIHRERKARADCDQNPLRLFLSSLTADDLELARREIANERSARIQDRCLLATRPAAAKPRKAACL